MEDEKKITDYWNKSSNSIWAAQIRGNWDLAVSVLARSNFEFGKIVNGFMNKFSKFILEKDVLLTEYSPVYAREYLTEAKPSEFVYGIPSAAYKLDDTDEKILKQLSTNSRISIIELIEKTKLSRDIITYRIKKLKKDNIIVQSRAYPNLQKLGINHYKVIIRTKNFDKESENKVRHYVASHKKQHNYSN